MTSQTRKEILFPVGRLVRGSLYKGNDKDAEGRPLVVKNGPSAGQPRLDFYFAVAIPKIAGHTHWAQTDWGQQIWVCGHSAFPGAAQSPTFAWKVTDGDSTIPNKKGKKPCDNEGYPGHWVVGFSSGYAPRIFTADGTQQITEQGAVKLGYFVQVFGNVDGNGSQSQPGVFLNHGMVAFAGYGPEITVGPDASAVGFGKGVTLPPGASATPLGGGFNPAPPVAPGVPGVPGVPAAPAVGVVPQMPAMVPPPAIGVVPNPAILQMPAAPQAPAMLPPQMPAMVPPAVPQMPAAAPAVPQMTAKAGGLSYAQFIGSGWTHEMMVANGYIA